MYGKLFASMYDGTLYGQWEAIVTFQQMIILCDSVGVLDMTPPALAARTSIPLDIIEKGISALESPDPYSRSPDQDGRRIERLDDHRPWGWRIINHHRYRQMGSVEAKKEADRERIARKRATSRNVSQPVAEVAYTDTNRRKKEHAQQVERESTFPAFWAVYPRRIGKADALKAWRSLNPDEALSDVILASVKSHMKIWERGDGKFVPYPASFLRGRRWEDEEAPSRDLGPRWNRDGQPMRPEDAF